jgi:hypothetical protein
MSPDFALRRPVPFKSLPTDGYCNRMALLDTELSEDTDPDRSFGKEDGADRKDADMLAVGTVNSSFPCTALFRGLGEPRFGLTLVPDAAIEAHDGFGNV